MKTALITGASSGIGMELAKLHASRGGHLVVVARNEARLQQLKDTLEQQYGIRVLVIAKDLTRSEAPQEIFDTVQRENITVDYLVNNAGFGDHDLFVNADWEKQYDMITLNITALTHLTKLFLTGMVNRKSGRILNLASTAAFQPGPTMAVYFATKAYVLHFSEAVNNEVRKSGVTVTALCPGITESNFADAANLEKSALLKTKNIPSAAEVAAYGYKAMLKGKAVAIHGWKNKLLAASVRFAPRSVIVKVSRWFTE